jgi:hypothetical protein
LAKIKVRAEENLERLPNYTCLETIERSSRRPSGKLQLVDVLRLEVAFAGRKELYAWPGSQQFEDRELFDMVGFGTIGTGSFALHARGVFLGSGPTFTYVGERMREGRRTIRYDYRVPRLASGYHLRVRRAEGIVGYHGSFWVDAGTLDLNRLEMVTDDIPPHVPVLSSSEALEYAHARIAGGDFLLPQSSELVLTDLAGVENRNRTSFTRCRQFAGESVLSFDEAPSSSSEEKRPKTEVKLESDLEVEVKLETAIETGVSAVGDEVRGVVARNVTKKGVVIIPKGAMVSGRILKLLRRSMHGSVVWSAGIRLTRVEFGDQYAELHLRLMASQMLAQFPATTGWRGVKEIPQEDTSGDTRIGILYISGEKGRISPGFRTQWITQTPKGERETR